MSKIKVVARVRPNIPSDPSNSQNPIHHLPPDDKNKFPRLKVTTNKEESATYELDEVFYLQSDQGAFYESIGKRLINGMLRGYNHTIITYGATGSGKSYSMLGPDGGQIDDKNTNGLIPRITEDLFRQFKEAKLPNSEKLRFSNTQVSVRFLQDYKGRLEDLLTKDRKHVALRNNRPHGAVEYKVKSIDDLRKVIIEANQRRVVSHHALNLTSSRSHTIFIIDCKFRDEENETETIGSLFMVDLCGIERAGRLEVDPSTMEEAKYINSSLSTLRLVIDALVHNEKAKKRKKKEKFVPFRSCLLTQVLKEALTGEVITTILLAISPCSELEQDQLAKSTLDFGFQARQLKLKPKRNASVMTGDKLKKNARKMQSEKSAFKKEQEKQKLEAKEKLKKRMVLMGIEDEEKEKREKKQREMAEKRAKLLNLRESLSSQIKSVETNPYFVNPSATQPHKEILDHIEKTKGFLQQPYREGVDESEAYNVDELTEEQIDNLVDSYSNSITNFKEYTSPRLDALELAERERQKGIDEAKSMLKCSIENAQSKIDSSQKDPDRVQSEEINQLESQAKALCDEYVSWLSNNADGLSADDLNAKKQEFEEKIKDLLDQISKQKADIKKQAEQAQEEFQSYCANIHSAMASMPDSQKDLKGECKKIHEEAQKWLNENKGNNDPEAFKNKIEELKKTMNPIFSQLDQNLVESKNAKNAMQIYLQNAKERLQRYQPDSNSDDDATFVSLLKEAQNVLEPDQNWLDENENENAQTYKNRLDALKEKFTPLNDKLDQELQNQQDRAQKSRQDLQVFLNMSRDSLTQYEPQDAHLQKEKDEGLNFIAGYDDWTRSHPSEYSSTYDSKKNEIESAIIPIEKKLQEGLKKEKQEKENAMNNMSGYLNTVSQTFAREKEKLSPEDQNEVNQILEQYKKCSEDPNASAQDLERLLNEAKEKLDGYVNLMLTVVIEEEEQADDSLEKDLNEVDEKPQSEVDALFAPSSSSSERLSNIFSTEVKELKKKFEGLPATLPDIVKLTNVFPPNKRHFLELGGFDKICKYLNKDDQYWSHCVIAASALSQMADFPEARTKARELNVCKNLLNVLQLASSGQSHMFATARCAEQLAENDQENTLQLQEYLLEPFILKMIETENQDAIQYICGALMKLSQYNDQVQEKLISIPNAMKKLCKLTFYDSQSLREEALQLIIALSQKNKEFRTSFAQNGGFDTIKNAFIWAREKRDEQGNLVRAEDTRILKLCGGALYNLFQDEEFKKIYEEWQFNSFMVGYILLYLAEIGNFSINEKETEMHISSDADDKFSFSGVSYYGEFNGRHLGGNYRDLTFRENPQYIIRNESGSNATVCFVIHDITPASMLRKNHAVYFGLHLIRSDPTLDEYHQVDISESVYRTLRGTSSGENYWIIKDLPVGEYRIIAYQANRDQESQYALAMYSTCTSGISMDPIQNDAWLRTVYEIDIDRSSSSVRGGTIQNSNWRNDPQFVLRLDTDSKLLVAAGYKDPQFVSDKLPQKDGKPPTLSIRQLHSAEDYVEKEFRSLDLVGSSVARTVNHTFINVDAKADEEQRFVLSVDTDELIEEPITVQLVVYAMSSYEMIPARDWHLATFKSENSWPEKSVLSFENTLDEVQPVTLMVEWENGKVDSDKSPPSLTFEIEDEKQIGEHPVSYLSGTDRSIVLLLRIDKKNKVKWTVCRDGDEYADSTAVIYRVFSAQPLEVTAEAPLTKIDEPKIVSISRPSKSSSREVSMQDILPKLLTEQISTDDQVDLTAEEQLLMNRIRELERELKESTTSDSQLEQQVKNLQSKLDQQEEKNDMLQKEIETLKKQLLNAQAQALEHSSQGLAEQENEYASMIKELRSALNQARAEASMNQMKLKSVEERSKTAEELCTQLDQQIVSLKEELQKNLGNQKNLVEISKLEQDGVIFSPRKTHAIGTKMDKEEIETLKLKIKEHEARAQAAMNEHSKGDTITPKASDQSNVQQSGTNKKSGACIVM